MFDQLDKVKVAWKDNKVVMLVNPLVTGNKEEKVTLIAPTSIFTMHMMKQMRSYGNNSVNVVISYEICKTLELPFIRTVYRAVSSRYPIIDYFLKQDETNKEISKSASSLVLDSVTTKYGNTDHDRYKTISEIGKLIDRFHSHEIKQNEFVDIFRKSFKIPGDVAVIRSSLGLLKSKVSIYELSLALCEISKYPMSAVISDMIDSKSGNYLPIDQADKLSTKHDIPIMHMKTTIDLWRSIMKVPKNQIADY